MVDGLQKDDTLRDLLVVDLDGTLLRTNSFTRFTIWFAIELLKRGMWCPFCNLSYWVGLRKIRRQTHAETKRRIAVMASRLLSDDDFLLFASSLRKYIREEVLNMATAHQSDGGVVVLATAAPAEYAVPLARMAGIKHVLASGLHIPEGGYMECRGEEKLRQVRDFCRPHDLQLATVVTDHYDDMPLMMEADRVVLVSPSPRTLQVVSSENIPYSIMK